MNTQMQLTPQQAFKIIDAACARATFNLTLFDFFDFVEAMKALKEITDAATTQKQ